MEEVIWKDDATNKLGFPKLLNMTISESPSLVSFCRGINEVEFPRLEELDLTDIPQIECLFGGKSNESIFPHKVLFPNLKKFEIGDMPNMKEIWCGQLQNGSFCYLAELDVYSCNKLHSVFTPFMARYLVHLKKLYIWNCFLLESVVDKEEEDKDGIEITTLLLPKLEKVELYDLPALQSFCHVAYDLELLMLKEVHIDECGEMKVFSPGCVLTPKLNYVNLNRYDDEDRLCVDNLNSTIRRLNEQNVKVKDLTEEASTSESAGPPSTTIAAPTNE